MLNTTIFIVEAMLLDSMNRIKKSRVIGVWRDLKDVPVDKIRRANELAYPKNKVEVKIHPYTQ
jgi:hypothetical protein